MATETWVLNETLYDTTSGMGFLVNINFTSNSTAFTEISITMRTGYSGLSVSYNSTTTYDSLRGSGWSNAAYKTITFATPPTGDLLTWLQANGTKQTPAISFKHRFKNDTLIGTGTYKFRLYSQEEPQSGELYIFNGTITLPSAKTYSVNFVSNGIEFNTMIIKSYRVTSTYQPLSLFYGTADLTRRAYVPTTAWTEESFRTITVTGGTDANNETFKTWLGSNAVKQ